MLLSMEVTLCTVFPRVPWNPCRDVAHVWNSVRIVVFSAVLYRLFDISPQFAKGKQNFILMYCSLCVLLAYFVAI